MISDLIDSPLIFPFTAQTDTAALFWEPVLVSENTIQQTILPMLRYLSVAAHKR